MPSILRLEKTVREVKSQYNEGIITKMEAACIVKKECEKIMDMEIRTAKSILETEKRYKEKN